LVICVIVPYSFQEAEQRLRCNFISPINTA
jgi:hypothetical protein